MNTDKQTRKIWGRLFALLPRKQKLEFFIVLPFWEYPPFSAR